jgi:hypothetical protein
MAHKVMLCKEFDVSKLSISDLKTLDFGGKIAYLQYDGKPFYLQTPQCFLPYGLGSLIPKDAMGNPTDEPAKYSLDLSFKGMDSRKTLQTFYKLFEDIDKFMIEKGLENKVAWFKNKRASKEVVEALYKESIRHNIDRDTGERNDKYPPTFKAKLPFSKYGTFNVEVYDSDKNKVTSEEGKALDADGMNSAVVKGSKAEAIIQPTSVWFAGGKFGISWKIVQLHVTTESQKLEKYAFVPDSDDEDDDEDDATFDSLDA